MKYNNKFDRNRKVPIFKDDLEFEMFHSQNLLQMDKDRLNFQKEYYVKISEYQTSLYMRWIPLW